jgi:hypothetical protein
MDDDRLIGAMVTALAEPRTPPPDALKRIDAAAAAARHRRRVARGATAAVLVAVVVAAVGVVVPRLSQHAEPTAPPGSRAIFSDGRSRLFALSFSVRYPAPVRLVHGAFTADGRTYDAVAWTAYSADQSDDLSLPLDAKAGETVYVSAHVRPNCAGDAVPPTAVLTLEMGGWATLTDHVEAGSAGTDQYLRQRAKWCEFGARADIVSVAHSPDGTVTYTLDVTNTTIHSVEVVSAAFRHGDAVWPRASVILKPGWTQKLQISATGYHRGDPKPWEVGLVTADGERIRVFPY